MKLALRYISAFIFTCLLTNCTKKDLTENPLSPSGDFFDNKNLKVLIVGSLEWQDAVNLPTFSKYHRKDAELEQTLLSMGVSSSNITALYDSNTKLENIYHALDKIAVASNADTRFIFYYAGHGFNGTNKEDKNNIYFANYDIEYWHADKTGFNINYLADNFSHKFKGSQFLFMADCCKSGGLINVAQKISLSGAKAAAITSSEASDFSTGNWTFTQKIIEGIKGDAFMNTNGDDKVTFYELVAGVDSAMKYNERQKSAAGFFNWNETESLNKNAVVVDPISTKNYFNGQYVYVKRNDKYWQTQIVGEKNNSLICRYYNYSDYELWPINMENIKVPYFITFPPGSTITIQFGTPQPAIVTTDKDGFSFVNEQNRNRTGWFTYEWLATGNEKKVKILNVQNSWEKGKVLEEKGNMFYVTYDDKKFTADEWVMSDRVKFY